MSRNNKILYNKSKDCQSTIKVYFLNLNHTKPRVKTDIINCEFGKLVTIVLGSCDSYVKIHLLPEEKFAEVNRPRTKTQKRNLFPLFDETFSM